MENALNYNNPDILKFIKNSPVGEPLKRITFNLENPPERNKLFIAVIFVCIAIFTIYYLIKAYIRVVLLRKVKIEDCK